MKKIVPDPPVQTCRCNHDHYLDAHYTTVAKNAGRQNLLTIRPGASAEETLRHVALLLLCAQQVSDEIQEIEGGVQRGLIWSMIHSVEISRALVEALLEGGKPSDG